MSTNPAHPSDPHATPLPETQRLRLRRMTEHDAAFILRLMNDRAYIAAVRDNNLRTIAHAEAYIRAKILPAYAKPGRGAFAMETKDDGIVIGFCGLFHREEHAMPDVGYAVAPEARGHGYAYEAAQAMLAFARDQLRLPGLNGLTEPSNRASIRILERLGLKYVRTYRMDGYPGETALYTITFDALPS